MIYVVYVIYMVYVRYVHTHTHTHNSNWLMQSWRLSPTICSQQIGKPGKVVVSFSPSPKAQEPGAPVSKDKRK